VENGGVFCKKVDLSSTQGALCTVSVFFILHFTYGKGGKGKGERGKEREKERRKGEWDKREGGGRNRERKKNGRERGEFCAVVIFP